MTYEVVGVEFGSHGGDAAAKDGLLAGLAQAPARLVVVGLAQGLSLVLKKAAIDEGAVALLKNVKQRGIFRERAACITYKHSKTVTNCN